MPCEAAGLSEVTVSVSPVGIGVPRRTLTFPDVSSASVSVSSSATGGWFTGGAVTVTETVPVAVPPWPSEMV